MSDVEREEAARRARFEAARRELCARLAQEAESVAADDPAHAALVRVRELAERLGSPEA